MEKIKSNKIKSIITILTIILVGSIAGKSFAVDATIYTLKLKKGDNLEFTGKMWDVYKTKAEAQSIGDGKHPVIKRNIKSKEKIKILEISGNTLKINKDEYIYYGSNAKNYFQKYEENTKLANIQNPKNNNNQTSILSTISKKNLTVPVYTSKLTKGESLVFIGQTWYVFKTKTEAQSVEEGKHPEIKRNIKSGEKIKILGICGNTLKINNNEYIYYGSNAKYYFQNVKDSTQTEKNKNTKNNDNNKKNNNNKKKEDNKSKNKKYTDGDYYVISNSLKDVLNNVGPQNPGECLAYACKYANYLLEDKSTSYRLIGCENKKTILKVVASEINEGRPVIARAATSNKKKINGKDMCGRHFVTIVRNKKECRFK